MNEFITAKEAKEIATPAYPIRVAKYLEETHAAICEAAKGGLRNIDIRIPFDIHEDVTKVIRDNGFQIIPRGEQREGMIFFRIGWN